MGEFTHAMRNPIRERDERIAALEEYVARLKEREADVVRQIVALMGQNGRLQLEVEARVDSRKTPKCKTTDCWICHGIPENAGPR